MDRYRKKGKENIHVYLRYATNKQLEFTLIEHIDQVLRDQLTEAAQKSIKLILDTLRGVIFDHEINIFLLVSFRDSDIGTTRLKVNGDRLAKALLHYRESFTCLDRNVVLSVVAT